jgi:anti-sigma factor RsiW
MSCSPYDLRDYLFEELTSAQEGEVRGHLKTCDPCTSELAALRSTHSSLLSVRDEEMPQRIGFVSDKVFEPSPVRRWFAGLWTSAAQLGFVSAAMLSAAILVHAVYPATQMVHKDAQPAVTQAQTNRQIQDAIALQVKAQVAAQVKSQVEGAVAQAVAETEERAQRRTNTLLAAAEKRLDLERWQLTLQTEHSRYTSLKNNAEMVRANFGSSPQ